MTSKKKRRTRRIAPLNATQEMLLAGLKPRTKRKTKGSPELNNVETPCIGFLRRRGFMAWKNPTTGTYSKQLGKYLKPHKNCIKGVSDAIAVKDGNVYFIEFKWKTKQSGDQKDFQKTLELHGGTYVLISSLQEMAEWVEEING